MAKEKTIIGIIGGSGFYQFLKGKEVEVKTPYGLPSDKIFISEYEGKEILFLPRHGRKHQLPPHKINYKANLFALKKLGCQRIISPSAVGSLKPQIRPGDFVVCDQFIDRTKREGTFFDGPEVVHISGSEPYCPELRKVAIQSCKSHKINCHKKGTVVIIEGPRFSTKAESEFYSKIGCDVINMTQYPEMVLARELEMCYVNISLVTDYDVGLKHRKDIKSVTTAQVLKIFRENNERIKQVILDMIKRMPKEKNCSCGQALKDAKI